MLLLYVQQIHAFLAFCKDVPVGIALVAGAVVAGAVVAGTVVTGPVCFSKISFVTGMFPLIQLIQACLSFIFLYFKMCLTHWQSVLSSFGSNRPPL